MNNLVVTSLAAGLTLAPGACRADPSGRDICEALSRLADQALHTGEPQRIGVFVDRPMETSCGLSDDTVRDDYCRAALDALGLEFHHRYPWLLAKCLRARGSRPRMETSDGYTGLNLPRVDHLTAGLPSGVRIDLRYAPDADANGDPYFRGYYGRYDLVAWRP